MSTNLPKRVIAPSFMGVNKEFFSGCARPELIWELEENLCIHHHVTFLNGLCFPPLFHYYFKPSCLVNNTKPRSDIEIKDYKDYQHTETEGSVEILYQPTTNGSVNRNTSG